MDILKQFALINTAVAGVAVMGTAAYCGDYVPGWVAALPFIFIGMLYASALAVILFCVVIDSVHQWRKQN